MSQVFSKLNEQVSHLQPWQLIAISSLSTAGLLYLSKYLSPDKILTLLENTPVVGAKMKDFVEKNVLEKVLSSFPSVDDKMENVLPSEGLESSAIFERMLKIKNSEYEQFEKKYVSGQVYSDDKELEKLLGDTYALYSLSNPLHPETFPSIRKFESEVIRMTCSMMNGDEKTCGTITTGGTESIIMAIFTYREWARDTKGITRPEIIVPVTAHAAFNKGAHYFGVKLIPVETDPETNQVDPKKVEKLINKNTIALVGSAPCYPTGTVDRIPELGQLALKYNIGLHVDSCLGGFFAPFARKLGVDIPAFDFSVPGVTTISADTHKYGLSTKGTSVLMFRDIHLRHYMYFLFPEWTGGIYASPGMAGSRAGGVIASCWAALMYHGEKGYMENTRKMLETANKIREGIKGIPELKLLGDSKLMVVSFASALSTMNIYNLIDAMGKRGWKINGLQLPAGAHFCVTMRVVGMEEEFLATLREAVEDVIANPKKYNSTGMMYGASAYLPTKQVTSLMGYLLDSWTDEKRASSSASQ